MCRKGPHTACALHGGVSRNQLEQSDQGILSVTAGKRKTEEAGPHRLHAKVAHDPEFNDEKQADMGSDASKQLAVFNAVADTFYCLRRLSLRVNAL